MRPCVILLLALSVAIAQDVWDDEEGYAPSIENNAGTVIPFLRKLYLASDSRDAEDLAYEFKKEYDALNTDGRLGITLNAVYEMRLEDLLSAVRYTRKVREVLTILETF